MIIITQRDILCNQNANVDTAKASQSVFIIPFSCLRTKRTRFPRVKYFNCWNFNLITYTESLALFLLYFENGSRIS